jgi:hypothetical protein
MKLITVYTEKTRKGADYTQIVIQSGPGDRVELALAGDHEDELIQVLHEWFASKQPLEHTERWRESVIVEKQTCKKVTTLYPLGDGPNGDGSSFQVPSRA